MTTSQPLPSFPEESARNDSRPPATVEQPPSIRTAVTLMRVGAGLAGLGLVIALATMSSMKDDTIADLRTTSPDLTTSELDTAYTVGIGFAIVLSLVIVGLWLWMASANGKGHKWARIVATVLGGLSIVVILISLAAGSGGALALVSNIVNLLVGAGALFYLYRPDSNRFYEVASRPVN
jgi:hypothetical protein